ncbi:hypothetical protein CC1G_08638 [Coprinopsis cinerea okayama7|uniref:Uncharacterized protein n=1 Tax=Coprinopsis cinerea (strain Okayama-7 / 130 / ATCC MYA-4618 / FGSC 9003) TaxID=240176 RepID=A8N0U1_COPC7|nr:hypothetical protein CC1G_08638 [Coprinopsis cinerea okayama7\|eukprot:XP_001828492.1 hypothetical protein CC1G_08638 [Coprinopsis cinerea okayama7\
MSASVRALNPEHWTITTSSDGSTVYTCKVCPNYTTPHIRHSTAHERSQGHQKAVQHAELEQTEGVTDFSQNPFPSGGDELVTDDVLRNIVSALHGNVVDNPPLPPYPPNHPSLRGIQLEHDAHWDRSPATGINYGIHQEHTQIESEHLQQLVTETTKTIMDLLDSDLSDFEWAERTDSDEDSSESDSDESDNFLYGYDEGEEGEPDGPRKRARGHRSDPATARSWFPWQDKLTCSLDLLMHLPRSVFSQRQLELFLWLLRVNGVDDVPSVKAMKRINESLQDLCGIDSKPYQGAMGNRFYVNNLSKILAQEMANPLVRPHLQFYPEDCGKRVSEAVHGARWLHELSHEDSTPMIRRGTTDYFIHEPAMIVDGSCCIPFRWFRRKGKFVAQAWRMETLTDENGREGCSS